MVSRVGGEEVGRWGMSAATCQLNEKILEVECAAK